MLDTATTVANLTKPAANGIDAELTIGTKDEQVNTRVLESNKQQHANNITNNELSGNMVLLLLLLMVVGIAGWALPTPETMFRNWRNKE